MDGHVGIDLDTEYALSPTQDLVGKGKVIQTGSSCLQVEGRQIQLNKIQTDRCACKRCFKLEVIVAPNNLLDVALRAFGEAVLAQCVVRIQFLVVEVGGENLVQVVP